MKWNIADTNPPERKQLLLRTIETTEFNSYMMLALYYKGEYYVDDQDVFVEDFVFSSDKIINRSIIGGWLLANDITLSSSLSILEEANDLIHGDRAAAYGSATDNFRRIATGWKTILDTTITPEQVGLCMAWLKIARQVGKPNRDNLIDAAGYLGCVEKVQKGE